MTKQQRIIELKQQIDSLDRQIKGTSNPDKLLKLELGKIEALSRLDELEKTFTRNNAIYTYYQ